MGTIAQRMKRQTIIDTLVYNTVRQLERDSIAVKVAQEKLARAKPNQVESAKAKLAFYENMFAQEIQTLSGTEMDVKMFNWEQKFELRRRLKAKQVQGFAHVGEV